MLILEWETTRFEVVVEQHDATSPLKVELSGREIIIDLGKFSCAATLYNRRMQPKRTSALALAASLLAVALWFTAGLTIGGTLAGHQRLTPASLQHWTSD